MPVACMSAHAHVPHLALLCGPVQQLGGCKYALQLYAVMPLLTAAQPHAAASCSRVGHAWHDCLAIYR